ncbi:MAG: DUF1552 domain-containing protein [Saprospiraceae bacterium]|nr:DUF1552 domain-containing protein [Saprospiraceae bacterium]
MITNNISRRRLLKGMGACVALPFLESLYPAKLHAAHHVSGNRPQRFACLFMPNGVHPRKWNPDKTGSDFELSPILKPLDSLKQEILILGGMMNMNSHTREDGHYTKTANFLTSMRIAKTVDAKVDSGGISLDQLMARHIGQNTYFPSLQYGLDRIRSGVDTAVGFTRLYGGTISWQGRNQPCSREIDPRMAFDRLFRNYVPGKKPLPEDPLKKSVLDLVKDDIKMLEKQLGIEDQNKLGEYLEAVSSVEKRLNDQGNLKDFERQITPDIRKELARMDLRIDEWAEYAEGVDVTEKTRLMLDIIVLAFWSDASRIATFMFGNSVSNRNFSFLDGVHGAHHSISHHTEDPRMLDQYEKINHWHIQQYAYLLEKLKSIKEGDSNLLDNSMILFGSGLRDGNRHSPFDLPIVLAGHGGGKLKTGQHLKFADETPLANLYLTLLHTMDIDVAQFGDSETVLCDILA